MLNNHQNILSSPPSSSISIDPGQFPSGLLTISILQILADSTQFTSIRPSSLATLTHLASRYLQLLAQSARSQADHSCRHHINAWDLSGVLENLHGPGTLASLLNWYIDYHHHHQPQSIHEPIDRLSQVSEKLREFNPSSSLEPITKLSFLPLTDAEVAELDRAGQSDPEDDHPSPTIISSDSGSSEDDSESECLLTQSTNLPPFDSPTPIGSTNPSQVQEPSPVGFDQGLVQSSSNWRSIDDIPDYVPAHFPPFPDLARPSTPPTRSDDRLPPPTLISEQSIDPPKSLPPPPSTDQHPPLNPSKLKSPYLFAVPYSQSQLYELHGEFIEPQKSVDLTDHQQPPSSPSSSPNRKRARVSGSLDGFLETYGYMVEEQITNNQNHDHQNKFMRPNPTKHRFLASDQTEPIHDSLFGSIPKCSIRSHRWSGGWIPHPPTKDGRLLPVPELKPFGYTPLPLPVTMPVPIQFPANPLFHQPHPRIPDLIPRWFQKISQDSKGIEKFTLINRLSRLGPPGELGESGESLPYQIEGLKSTTSHNNQKNSATAINNNDSSTNEGSNDNPTNSPSSSLTQAKYMKWGFLWTAHEGSHPLPPPKSSDLILDFKPIDFPGMPKTTAQRNRSSYQKE